VIDPATITHEVRCADCLGPEGLALLPDKSVDHVICDPPYSAWVHAQHMIGGGARRNGSARYKDLGFGAISVDAMTTAAEQFARVSRRWVIVFCAAEMVGSWRDAMTDKGLEHVRVGVWVKGGATPQFSGDRPAPGFESIEIAHPAGRKTWNGGGRHAVWLADVPRGDRHHTTQKPIDLMEQLVRDFTDPGDLILDAFAGSGTTGVAAKRLGRRFIGWERDPKYHAIAEKRIASAREQRQLFAERGPDPVQVPLLGGSR
jgi:site-specific DNA-methyltransferase (adenine-specific)